MSRDYKEIESMHPLDRIRELLYPSDSTYCAEPISIEDARWLLERLDRFMSYVNSMTLEDKE